VDTVLAVTRREFLAATSGALAAGPLARLIPLRQGPALPKKPVRLAVIADLHHGLAPDAMGRLEAFVKATKARKGLDAVIQMGDFCYSQPDSKPCTDLWRTLDLPMIHVLGNHDMDKVDKTEAMRYFGMPAPYYSRVIGGYRFVVLDLNHFRKGGKLYDYANGNYFTEGAACNYADPEQLDWLDKELRRSKEPVVLLSHQPLGFKEPNQPMPAEQIEVLDVVTKTQKVVASMFGHLHVDRLEGYQGLPCYCVNSASYFWYNGMRAYTNPLYAFMELTPDGHLKVEGREGEFVQTPPKESDNVIGRSASIMDRSIGLKETS